MKRVLPLVASIASICILWGASPAHALKYAAPEHSMKADPSIPHWNPGEVKSVPEEELPIVGADIMEWQPVKAPARRGRNGSAMNGGAHRHPARHERERRWG